MAVRNECYRILQQNKTHSRKLEAVKILEPVDREDFDEELQSKIELALHSLPADQREVTHMKVYEQMTFQQIADELEISINTASSRYRYAMDKLREILGPDSPMEDN